ncbi:21997_t:CDS:2, partial [Entrophospora sp. SA101]
EKKNGLKHGSKLKKAVVSEACYDEIMHSEDAWEIEDEDGAEDEFKPTKSAKKLMNLLELEKKNGLKHGSKLKKAVVSEACYDEIMHSEDAWEIEDEDGAEDEFKPTKSAKKLMNLLELEIMIILVEIIIIVIEKDICNDISNNNGCQKKAKDCIYNNNTTYECRRVGGNGGSKVINKQTHNGIKMIKKRSHDGSIATIYRAEDTKNHYIS